MNEIAAGFTWKTLLKDVCKTLYNPIHPQRVCQPEAAAHLCVLVVLLCCASVTTSTGNYLQQLLAYCAQRLSFATGSETVLRCGKEVVLPICVEESPGHLAHGLLDMLLRDVAYVQDVDKMQQRLFGHRV